MEVHNCRMCHRLFNYLSGPDICPACHSDLEKKYEEVRDYIRANPKSTLVEISAETNVTQQQIKQWIREERLQFSKDSIVGIECESCGATIRTGRFCENCKKNMANTLSKLYNNDTEPVKKKRDGNKMRFLEQ